MGSYAITGTANYDPNLNTSVSGSGPGVDYGTGSGLGFNIDEWLAKAFAMKQKGNEEDWYWKQRQAQEDAARQAAALKDAERMQNEEMARARREQMGAAMDYAALMQNMQGPITYKFTDVGNAARVFGREIPARYAAMAAGRGSSHYGGSAGDDRSAQGYGSFNNFQTSSRERLPYASDDEESASSSAASSSEKSDSTQSAAKK